MTDPITRGEFTAGLTSLRDSMESSRAEQAGQLNRMDAKLDGLIGQVAAYSRDTGRLETRMDGFDKDLAEAKIICATRDEATNKRQERIGNWLMGLVGALIMTLIGAFVSMVTKK